MVMQRWDPFTEMRRMQETMDRLWRGGLWGAEALEPGASTMPMDVIETQDSIVVRVAIPGIDPQELKVAFEDGVLTIGAERREERQEDQGRYLMRETAEGVFRRAVRLPNVIDADRAESGCANGMLTITFPKLEQKKAKRIEIKADGERQQLEAGRTEEAA